MFPKQVMFNKITIKLKSFIFKLWNKNVKKTNLNKSTETDYLLNCISVYNSIEPNELNDISQEKLFFVSINSKYKNIEEYTKYIDQLIYIITNDKVITTDLITYDWFDLTSEQFFTDKENFYLDIINSFMEFKTNVILLCHELLLDRDTLGVHEHNRVITINIIRNLIDIGNQIKSLR